MQREEKMNGRALSSDATRDKSKATLVTGAVQSEQTRVSEVFFFPPGTVS